MTVLIVYVDIILTEDNIVAMERLKKCLATKFEEKDLGQMRYFLGMEIAKSKKGISLSQQKYILDLLIKISMLGCKPSDTPIEAGKIKKNTENSVGIDRYQRLVGKLIYLSHTSSDITFTISLVSQHIHSPKETHLEAVYNILRYLKGKARKGLLFERNTKKGIEVLTDSDWGLDQSKIEDPI
ncbi:uncharacterized protein LOC111390064 [Olea europaea var. sylvestris]|uniref:uncharacterized protein LOC111390064 n=1 Tax=Olea europaea var. sylvestris TaxID=158386 RepID=UPI000C1D6C4F|nr:uncharacterized protein LOC111390064 [Olea europaea var. sylvestris]